MKKLEFLQKLKDGGMSDPVKLKNALDQYRQMTGRSFDDDPQAVKTTAISAPVDKVETPQNLGIIPQIERGLTENEQKVGQQLAQPERYPLQHVVQGATGILNQVGAVVGPPLKEAAIGLIGGLTPQEREIAKRSIGGIMKPFQPVGVKLAEIGQKAPIVGDVAQLGLGAAGVMPMTAGAARVVGPQVGPAVTATGKAVEGALTRGLVGEIGLLKPLSKKLGNTFAEAKENLGSIIKKYNLSDIRGFKSATEKADAMAASKTKQADELIGQFAIDNPKGEKYDVGKDIFKDIKANIAEYVRPGEEKSALSVIDDIEESVMGRLKSKGYQKGRTVPIDELVEVKRSLNPRFKNKSIADDPVKEKMYEVAYLKAMDSINSKVKQAGVLNKEAHEIWLAKDAMEEAAGRNDKLTNTILGTAIGAAGAGGIIAKPEAAIPIALGAVGLELGRRAVTQGRAISAGIGASQGIQKIGKTIEKVGGVPISSLKGK